MINEELSRRRFANMPTPKEKQLQRFKHGRLQLLQKHYQKPLEELVSPSSPWIIVLNASYDGGITGPQLLDIFGNFPGYKRIEMYLGGEPFSFVEFNDCDCAQLAFEAVDGIWSPIVKKQLLLAFATYIPPFPDKPLIDPLQVAEKIPGLFLHPDFISHEDQDLYLKHIELEGLAGRWQILNKRTVQHYSFRFDYPSKSVDRNGIESDFDLPSWISPMLDQYQRHYPHLPRPDQLTLNHYSPGGGIAPHTDRHSSFLSPILIVSLSSAIVMEFRKKIDFENNTYQTHFVLLEPRSLVIMGGESRYGWEHVIRPRKMDLINGMVIERTDRYSLTFRNVRSPDDLCTCSFKHLCD